MATGGLRMSINEKEFILEALRQEQRIDGRSPFDYRELKLNFLKHKEGGSVEVHLGHTRVLCVVSGQITQPYPDRPNEGSLAIFTEFSPMADPVFEPGRPSEMAVELGRIIDRGLRESKAVDTESLCILAGRSVWAIRVDIHVLDNGGNLIDAANLAALAALLSYRRPECTVGGDDGQEIIVHPPEVREPIGLIIHHMPIAITFAFFGNGDLEVLDPNLKEEEVMGGRLTIIANAQGEICAIHKGGGVGVSTSEILRCLRIAAAKAQTITETLKKAVEVHEVDRTQRKIRRHHNNATHIDVVAASSIPNVEREVEMEDALVIPKTAGDTKTLEEESSSSDEDETEMVDFQVQDKPKSGNGDMFLGGEPAWDDDMKLTPLTGASGAKSSVFPLDSNALIEFDAAAKALVRGGALSSRSANLVPAALQRQISGQIAAAAVYANQSLPQISDDVQPLGRIFPCVADVDSVDISSLDTDDAQARRTETKSESLSGKKKRGRVVVQGKIDDNEPSEKTI